ncbi:MAG: hypothetical protein ACREVW_14700, partial [Burkholderiales bacterium]
SSLACALFRNFAFLCVLSFLAPTSPEGECPPQQIASRYVVLYAIKVKHLRLKLLRQRSYCRP